MLTVSVSLRYMLPSNLCGLPNVILPNPHRIQEALVWYSDGLNVADALHLASSQPCKSFFTFAQKFVRKAQGLSKCTVKAWLFKRLPCKKPRIRKSAAFSFSPHSSFYCFKFTRSCNLWADVVITTLELAS